MRDLSKLPVACLSVDAIRIGIRLENSRKHAVLAAYVTLTDGSFETLSVGLGNEESNDLWGEFIADLKARGLADPLLVISDCNPGVVGRRRIRTSNMLERVNHEVRGRIDVIGRHPSEAGCLALVFQITRRHASRRKTFGCGDLVARLWWRLRNQKLEVVTQIDLALATQAS